jgi:tetratricopeptide (TPR) repeat protein
MQRRGGGGPGRPRDPIGEEIRRVAKPGAGDRAVRAFQRAVDLLERDRPQAAVAPATEAKALAGRSGAVREVLGLALYGAARYQEALGELQAYRRMTGRLDQNHVIADVHRALGHPEKSIEPVREVLRARVPDEVRAESAIVGASALADMGRIDEGLALLRQVRTDPRAAKPWALRVWYTTGDLLARSGRTKEAETEFRRVLRHDPGAFDTAERLAALA